MIVKKCRRENWNPCFTCFLSPCFRFFIVLVGKLEKLFYFSSFKFLTKKTVKEEEWNVRTELEFWWIFRVEVCHEFLIILNLALFGEKWKTLCACFKFYWNSNENLSCFFEANSSWLNSSLSKWTIQIDHDVMQISFIGDFMTHLKWNFNKWWMNNRWKFSGKFKMNHGLWHHQYSFKNDVIKNSFSSYRHVQSSLKKILT